MDNIFYIEEGLNEADDLLDSSREEALLRESARSYALAACIEDGIETSEENLRRYFEQYAPEEILDLPVVLLRRRVAVDRAVDELM